MILALLLVRRFFRGFRVLLFGASFSEEGESGFQVGRLGFCGLEGLGVWGLGV